MDNSNDESSQTKSANLLDLYNNGKKSLSVSLSELEAPIKPLNKKIELKKRLPPPEPTGLKLIIITCKTVLNSNINLDLIARQLAIDDEIKGKKLLSVAEEGAIKSKPKNYRNNKNKQQKKQKNHNSSRKDFSNQCTVIVHPIGYEKQLNLKLFGNGKIVITGGLTKEDGLGAVTVLKNKIKDLEGDYQIKPNTQFIAYFDSVQTYIKYMNKNYVIFLKLFALYGIQINLHLDIILNKKLVEKYPVICPLTGQQTEKDLRNSNIEDLIKENILMTGSQKDFDDFLKIIQIFNICHLYFTNTTFLAKLNQPDDFIHKIIDRLYNFENVTLPVTFDKEEFARVHEITIENYNTMFNCNFHLDREAFTQLLANKYKNIISSAKFEPTNYQGINTKYISRVMCQPDCKSLGGKKRSKCPCKEISCLIFQEGNVIITGGRSWDQILDGYNVITKIMKDDYYNIMVEQPLCAEASIKNLPPQIIKCGDGGKKIIYLNKKQQIIENPRNYFLLKQLNLLGKYL